MAGQTVKQRNIGITDIEINEKENSPTERENKSIGNKEYTDSARRQHRNDREQKERQWTERERATEKLREPETEDREKKRGKEEDNIHNRIVSKGKRAV